MSFLKRAAARLEIIGRAMKIGNLAAGRAADEAVNKGQLDGEVTILNASIDDLGSSITSLTSTVNAIRPYAIWAGFLTQTGTGAPTAVVLQNTLGGTIVWSYDREGQYIGTLSGVFTANKTAIIGTSKEATNMITAGARLSNNTIVISTMGGGVAANSQLNNTFVEIRVYTS